MNKPTLKQLKERISENGGEFRNGFVYINGVEKGSIWFGSDCLEADVLGRKNIVNHGANWEKTIDSFFE